MFVNDLLMKVIIKCYQSQIAKKNKKKNSKYTSMWKNKTQCFTGIVLF